MTPPMHPALSEFCHIIQGGRHKQSGNDFVESGFPAYGAGGLNGLLPNFEFDQAAIVLSSIGARCGKCFFAEGKWSSLANTQVILPDLNRADPRFLWFQLNDEGRWHRSGTAQPFIKPSDVKAHRVYLPPLTEQRRIAAILDQADALRAKRRAALAHLDEMARAIFVEMFGSIEANHCRWPRERFEQVVADARIGLVRSSSDVGPEHPHRYLKMDAIGTNGDLDLERATRTFASADEVLAYSLASGDFLFNTRNSRELVGKCAIFRSIDLHLFNNNIMRVRFRPGMVAEYVLAAFRTPALRQEIETKKSGTTSVFAIYWKDLKTLQIPVPPTALQTAFAERMGAIRASAEIKREQGAGFDRLFASLQHRAFRGEL